MKSDLEKSLKAADIKKPATKSLAPVSLAARLSPASQTKAIKPAEVRDAFPEQTAFKFGFLGCGQGGGKIAHAYWNLGYRRVGIFNTTDTDFAGLDPEVPRLSLDVGGAAKDMGLARGALVGREEEVWDLMTRAWGSSLDIALITVSLGGGTGSGTALPIILQARKYLESLKREPRVGAVVSLPSADDGQVMARNAITAFRELIDNKVSPILVIHNERVHELYCPGMSELLPKSNELVSELLHLFNKLAAVRSKYITFDQAEFGQLLDGGIVVMGATNIDVEALTSPAVVSTAIREQLANSVLADVDLRGGRTAACLFVGSEDVLGRFSKDYFAAGFSMLDRLVGSTRKDLAEQPTVIHRGLYEDENPEATNSLQCYTMVSGLDAPATRLRELAKQAGVVLTARPAQKPQQTSGAHFLNVD